MKKINTKIFCDIAELKQIKKFNKKKIVKGFTTNPSLMKKAGAKDYKAYSKKILNICQNKPVSLEVFADDYKNMRDQALKINQWGKNVYVKIPVTNSKGVFSGKIIKELNKTSYNIDLFNMFSIKEINSKIVKYLKQYDKVITIEEQNLPGGIGSIISEIIADNNINVRLKRFGINDKYILKCGNRDWLKKKYGLDDQTLYKNIKNFCDKKNFI